MAKDEAKTVTIYIDGDPFEEPRGKIKYERVVDLAYPDFAQYPNATYSIVYERGNADKPQGTLTKGAEVQIVKDMRFRVKRTGES
ncbi:MAG TPA: multiubiquitin domain-containing protein [Allosphingosinicella sp.]